MVHRSESAHIDVHEELLDTRVNLHSIVESVDDSKDTGVSTQPIDQW